MWEPWPRYKTSGLSFLLATHENNNVPFHSYWRSADTLIPNWTPGLKSEAPCLLSVFLTSAPYWHPC